MFTFENIKKAQVNMKEDQYLKDMRCHEDLK